MESADRTSPSVDELLKGLPADAREAYGCFLKTGQAADLDTVIHAGISLYLPAGSAVDLSTMPDDAALIDDLGFDSLAMTELVFFTEDLFGITIEDEELLGLRTLKDLKRFVRAKLHQAGIAVNQT